MGRFCLKTFIIVLIGMIIAGCHAKRSGTSLVGSNVVFGDSIAFGSGGRTVDLARCLSQSTGERYLNRGIPGQTTRGARLVLADVESLRPRKLVLSLGGNDVLNDLRRFTQPRDLWFGTFPVQETLTNLRYIFERLRALNTKVIYLDESPPLTVRDPRSWYARYDGRLGQIAKVAADFPNVTVITDAMSGIWLRPDRMADDIHPNDEGYRILCGRVVDAVSGQ